MHGFSIIQATDHGSKLIVKMRFGYMAFRVSMMRLDDTAELDTEPFS